MWPDARGHRWIVKASQVVARIDFEGGMRVAPPSAVEGYRMDQTTHMTAGPADSLGRPTPVVVRTDRGETYKNQVTWK